MLSEPELGPEFVSSTELCSEIEEALVASGFRKEHADLPR